MLISNLASVYYSYSTSTSSSSGLHGGVLAGLLIFYAVVIIYTVFIYWKLFVKAGRPGWAAIVPVYNGWVFFEICGKPGWWIFFYLFAIIPFVGFIVPLVFLILAMISLGKRFRKSMTFTVVALILFSVVGISILAFGSSQYHDNEEDGPGVNNDPKYPPVNPGPTPTPPTQTPLAPQV